jgi:hypothetical protein
MTRDELRLELLRLTYSHGRDSAEAVERAKVLESYVTDIKESTPAPSVVESKKKFGKSNTLG